MSRTSLAVLMVVEFMLTAPLSPRAQTQAASVSVAAQEAAGPTATANVARRAQTREATPLRQSRLTPEQVTARPLTLRDASRDDRWFGLGVRDIRWAPDGSVVYFRWNRDPSVNDLDSEDPWFRVGPDGDWAEEVPREEWDLVPAASVAWSQDTARATWVGAGAVFLFEGNAARTAERPATVRRVVTLDRAARNPRFTPDGEAIDFETAETLYRYRIPDGALSVLATKFVRRDDSGTEAATWLAEQQRELFEHIRRQLDRRERAASGARLDPGTPQPIPVSGTETLDQIRMSPDGRFMTFRARRRDPRRPPTEYVDFVDESGYAQVHEARSKVGEPRDVYRLGVVRFDPTVLPDEVEVRWFELDGAGNRNTVPHGPWWNLEGTRAVAQFISEDHRDLWFAELDLEGGTVRVLSHDHDDAWIGGPPVQANYLQPALLEWLPGDRFVFASERSGWSHLYRLDPDGTTTALTEGEWEVRGAALSRDRRTWLLQASREHPADDHLYTMPATGGEMIRLTSAPGRHEGYLSPAGDRLAVVHGESVELPDLFVGALGSTEASAGSTSGGAAAAALTRVTVSGTDAFREHPLVRPEIVSFTHPDGGPLWAALFEPDEPNPEHAAVIHIHGGGYRQFAHRGWTVYGYALHLGLVNYLVQQGYTVLDFDYRGSAGYGRDYRTDIAGAMGIKDTDGAIAAARYLANERGVDPARIGIYGVSYGGFLTLMAQFRYPGVFAAGIARAAVTDWAHYSDGWTSRVLGVPAENPEAYRRSSPIYYADGLEDALLITHGLVDDNVHFQDAARLIQRLIELEKEFEVMVYPVEPHTIQTEASRYDYVLRAVRFFDRHLLQR